MSDDRESGAGSADGGVADVDDGGGDDAADGNGSDGDGGDGSRPDIRALDQATVQRIAAGEVVERPASVVKELVENALDADAARVRVAVERGGTDGIRVRDDGHGMTESALRLAVEEHTTSKIRDIDDLEAGVDTLGFRGEALHTIGAVSRLTIRSKPRGATGAGTELRMEGGEVTAVEPVGCPEGTTVEVEDLFFNTPARRKFLKTEATEFDHVNAVATHYALANPDVAVALEHDGREVFATEGRGSLESTVLSVYGREVAESMVRVGADESGNPDLDGPVESVTGLVSHPETTRAGREYLSTFVNGRYVASGTLREAVLDAYGDQLAPDRYPFAVLFVDVPPDAVDVNVHPRKMEVRFDDESAVTRAVRGAVRDALLSNGLIRSSAPRGRSAPDEAAVSPGTTDETGDDTSIEGEGTADRRADAVGRGADTVDASGASPTGTSGTESTDSAEANSTGASGSGTDDGGAATATDEVDGVEWRDGPESSDSPGATDSTGTTGSTAADTPAPADGPSSTDDPDRDRGSTDTNSEGDATGTTTEASTPSTPVDEPPFDDAGTGTGSESDGATGTGPNASPERSGTGTGKDADVEADVDGEGGESGPHARRPFAAASAQRTLDGEAATPAPDLDNLPRMRVLGQLYDTYLVAETEGGLVLVDQHAADERVNYERLRESLAGETPTQALADPVTLELTAREAALFEEYREALAQVGFHAGRTGERTVEVRTVPAVFDATLDPERLRDALGAFVAEERDGGRETVDAVADDLLADLACYPSVTGNTSLREGSVVDLLEALDGCENPYACPHGRPVLIRFDRDEIEDRFERDYPGHAGRRRER